MEINKKELDKHITGNYGEDQFDNEMNLIEINIDNAEIMAAQLYYLSCNIGTAINTIDDMAKLNWSAVTNNIEQYEFIMAHGDNFIRAVRIIATTLDRAVVIKCQKDD